MENLKLNKSNSSVLISLLLFILFLSITTTYYLFATTTVEENSRSIFDGEVDRINSELISRLAFYGNILNSMKGLFESSEFVDQEEFKKFITGISVSSEFAPILSFSYIEKTLSDGYAVKYAEPRNAQNDKLIGVDFSELYPETIRNSIITGEPVATDIFVNPYLNLNEIIVILPVYVGGLTGQMIEERAQNISGFVSLSFKTRDFFDDIFFPGSPSRLIITDIFEGNQESQESLIYSNSIYPANYSPEYTHIEARELAGKSWIVKFSTTKNFSDSVMQKNKVIYITVAGFIISILISFMTYSLLSSRNRALKLAEIMTKDLGNSEQKLKKLNRALLTISEANQIVVKEKDEQKLLDSVCNILIKIAGYRLVWIGYVEHDEGKTVRVASWAGHSNGYIEKLRVTWSGSDPRGRGPAGRAIREGAMVVEPDFSKDLNFDPWREDADMRGYKGGIFIPLISGNKLLGSLNIYSAEKDVFSKEETDMLRELADDVAFSVLSIRIEAERDNAEKALRESEELLSKYMENSPVYTFIKEITPDSIRVVRASSNYSEMVGDKAKNIKGKTMEELFPADFAAKINADDRSVMESGKVLRLDEDFNGRNYTTIKFPIILGDKKLLAGYTMDITDRKLAERKLVKKMEELQQFRLAVDNASDHIIITDPNAKILYANKGAMETTGYSSKELIGNTPALWGGQMPKEFYEKMWHTIKVDKKSFVGELKNKRKNGQLYEAEFSVSPILSDAGEIIYFVGVERDITKAKEIEKSKNEFVSLASHQLRTPLTAINWYTEMLLGGDAGKLNEKQKGYIEELEGSSRRMTDLVSALLNVSRIDLGTFTINPKPTDIVKISKTVIKDLFVKINNKKIKVVEEYGKLPEIKADPNLVNIILQNLITNAIKYTPELGTVRIGIKEEGEYIVVEVEDNGYGIPAYQQDRIFEKFFRADNIVPIETDGNGLGLYMVKQIIASVGGSISFTSKEGEGTTFVVKMLVSGMLHREGTRILDQKGFGV